MKNSDGYYFIPNPIVGTLVTVTSVRDTLRDCGIVVESLDELVQAIVEGARNVFAILVWIRQVQQSSRFVRHDQFQSPLIHIDHKLPFSLETLGQILGPTAAREFFERQWEFAAPVFSRRLLPRSLTEDTVLPILETRHIGSGGFGEAYEITIQPNHVDFSDSVGPTVEYL